MLALGADSSSNLGMQDSPSQWATKEFGGAQIHGAQRKQVIRVAAGVARRPAGTVSGSMRSDADRQSAYGLLEGDVAADALAQARSIATAERAAEYPFVFVPTDGSAVAVTDRDKSKGMGPIGSPPAAARGLKVMSAIAVSPDGTPLGVAKQEYWSRGEKRRLKDHASRPIEERETVHWLHVSLAVAALFAKHAPKTRPWFQYDREGDFKEMLALVVSACLLATIRANHDRRCGSRAARQLWSTMRHQRVLGTYPLHVQPGPNRVERDVTMVVRAAEVRLCLGKGKRAAKSAVTLHAVYVVEKSPPKGAERIEWLLLTTHKVVTLADAQLVVRGYAARWTIEVFHKTWKSGLCHVEQMQLRSRPALEKMSIILASVAMRAARLTHLAREKPNEPASTELDDFEIDAIIALRQPRGYDHRTRPTLAQAVRWIGDIGGYVGNKSSGPPGNTVVGRGLVEVEIAARALRYAEERRTS